MDWMIFGLFLIACTGAGATGALFPPGDWYRRLDKPAWTPPDWLFPLAWTYLYVAIAWAAARVAHLPGAEVALALWAAQIAWNALWTPVFFGLRRLKAALAVLAVLWALVLLAAVAFAMLDRLTLIAFVPYVVWTSYAGALNADILRRNGGRAAAA
ncbi:TspO/MBR related protein [Hasllibacter halocynthiae]|uniref:TspO/MBR related protein n=1 Tax=Hasllibacter halocynthiae TaxID=595589 RepID=A0A2T0X2Y1_9RHOB|nr:TspO/MBR family protein [Hasllibacter halocynthiae]PRY93267.1 TspO/MBR related protein [Hasllibacter halocynthiae]